LTAITTRNFFWLVCKNCNALAGSPHRAVSAAIAEVS